MLLAVFWFKRSNATYELTADPDAHLARKSDGDASRLCYIGHVLMENRNGLLENSPNGKSGLKYN